MAHIGSKYYGGVHVPVTCTSVVCRCGWVSVGGGGGGGGVLREAKHIHIGSELGMSI